MPNEGVLMQAEHLDFSYSSLPVVVDVSLSLPPGAVGALIGANGSGKSTLIRLLAGLLHSSSGEVVFDGVPLSTINPRERQRTPTFQATSNVFTALEVVLTGRSPTAGDFGLRVHVTTNRFEAIDSLDAGHLASRHITELSASANCHSCSCLGPTAGAAVAR